MADIRFEKYEPDEAGWDKMSLAQELFDACLSEARKGEQFAVAISPEESGEYKNSFHVVPQVTHEFAWGPRASAVLYNDSDHADEVEYGGPRNRPHRIFGRTAEYLAR